MKACFVYVALFYAREFDKILWILSQRYISFLQNINRKTLDTEKFKFEKKIQDIFPFTKYLNGSFELFGIWIFGRRVAPRVIGWKSTPLENFNRIFLKIWESKIFQF